MVQTISLIDTKELTPQKGFKDTKISSNVDFLELLMNDIANNDVEDKDKLKEVLDKNSQQKDQDEKKDLLSELLNKKIDIKDLDNKDIKSVIESNPKINEDIIKEVKNIISSKIKQDNILMSKSDIKEFKKIDNIKDLIKFADKKGLDIKKIKFELPKETKENITQVLKTDISSNQKIEHVDTNKILEKKQNNKKLKTTNVKKDSKNQTKIQKNNQVSLESILSKSEKKVKNISSTNNTKSNTTSKTDITLESLIQKPKLKQTEEVKVESHKKIDIKTKEIDISEILLPKTDKKIVKDKQQSQPEINLNQQAINEVKAKSVQAKQTIDSFKNNLDDAIKNYKPPISKVDIELNPKNLGKVEVSIVQRGNNIQVHMNTDQSNVALFQNHQAEFRQALASIGFSNIDMSFNSNQDRDRKQQQAKKTYKENDSIEDIADIEINAKYQYA